MTSSSPGAAAEPQVIERRLSNGMLVLMKVNHNAPVVNLNVAYRIGSKYEPHGQTGISHLLEHMMFKTTSTYPLGEFDRQLKAVGSDNNAYTWLDQTVYHETIAADQVEVALRLEADRMVNLSILPEDHAFEMTVVRNELDQRDDNPFTLLYEEMLSHAFQAHPYRVPTIGYASDVEAITTEELKEHYRRYYCPANAFIVVGGDFEPEVMLGRIEHYFGAIPAGEQRYPRVTPEPAQIGERRFTIRRAGSVDFLLCAWHIPESTHPDTYALVVLGNILGQGRTSRLYRSLVDSGLCADASSSSGAFGYRDPFLFIVSATLNPGNSPETIEPLVYSAIEQIIAEAVSEDELKRARKQAQASFIFERDSVEREAGTLVDFELISSWKELERYLPGIEAVSAADVQRVAARYFSETNRTVGIYHALRQQAASTEDEADAATEEGDMDVE